MTAIHQDKLLRKLGEWKGEDASRASEVGEQRADIKDFLELTGWNKTSLALIRKLDKLDVEKRADILRSFDDLREIMEKAWNGQSTADMFDDAVEPAEAPKSDAPMSEGDPEIAAEADDFDRHLAKAAE